jgi:DNA-binding MarR family transcriptional regulator
MSTYEKSLSNLTSFLLYQATRLWQKHFSAALVPVRLTPAQFGVLVHVGLLLSRRGPVSQSMLSKAIHNEPMTISQITRALEKKGLVSRTRQPGDSRANSVSITPAGNDVLTKSLEIALRARKEFFAPLGSREATLNSLLSRLVEARRQP